MAKHQILIWLILINGPILAVLSAGADAASVSMTPEQVRAETMTVFAVMAGIFGTIGAIIAIQGAIIDEKKSGTAAWIMSKPASRAAFILAKLLANAAALLVVLLVVQGGIAYLQLSLSGSPPPLSRYLGGVALLALNQLFYLSFALMLGTFFGERGPVIGIPMGVLFAPMFILPYVGQAAYLTPWLLVPAGSVQGLVVEAMTGQPLSTPVPILATIFWIAGFVAVALWRFGQEEF